MQLARSHRSELLVYATVTALENGEACALGFGNRYRFEDFWCIHTRNEFANRLFTEGAMGKGRPGNRAPELEASTAHLALPFRDFIFIGGHE